jgi:hypothetical protein
MVYLAYPGVQVLPVQAVTIRVENDKETFHSFPEKKETKSKKRKRKRYYVEKERKRNILNGNGRGNG